MAPVDELKLSPEGTTVKPPPLVPAMVAGAEEDVVQKAPEAYENASDADGDTVSVTAAVEAQLFAGSLLIVTL